MTEIVEGTVQLLEKRRWKILLSLEELDPWWLIEELNSCLNFSCDPWWIQFFQETRPKVEELIETCLPLQRSRPSVCDKISMGKFYFSWRWRTLFGELNSLSSNTRLQKKSCGGSSLLYCGQCRSNHAQCAGHMSPVPKIKAIHRVSSKLLVLIGPVPSSSH